VLARMHPGHPRLSAPWRRVRGLRREPQRNVLIYREQHAMNVPSGIPATPGPEEGQVLTGSGGVDVESVVQVCFVCFEFSATVRNGNQDALEHDEVREPVGGCA
jgi:hypothetical protein